MRGILAVLVLMIAGCASSQGNLQRETARLIQLNVAPAAIEISDIQRGLTTVTWKANTQGRHYQCTADDLVLHPYCFEARP
jgi:hypothetical protein